MREETKRSLEELLSNAEACDDPNLRESARVVRKDLLNGGQNVGQHGRMEANRDLEPDPAPAAEGEPVVWKPKKKR